MIYLIVGVDRRTLEPWHANVAGRDSAAAARVARARARARGVDLVLAAAIGPGGAVVAGAGDRPLMRAA